MLHISDAALDGAETRESDPALALEVTQRAHVDPLDQVLLKQQGMVGTQCTGIVMVTLMVVA